MTGSNPEGCRQPGTAQLWSAGAFSPVVLAQLDEPVVGGFMTTSTNERLIFIAALLAVTVILIIIAAAFHDRFRKKKRKRIRSQSTVEERPEPVEKHRSHRHRHGRRHRVERPMNPTLAQTGGLPPVRTDSQSDGPSGPTQPD